MYLFTALTRIHMGSGRENEISPDWWCYLPLIQPLPVFPTFKAVKMHRPLHV